MSLLRPQRPHPAPVPRPARGAEGPLFAFDDVVVERGGTQVLAVDHLEIPCTGTTAIVGPSGSGKSTLLRLCNRLEVPARGSVRFRGVDLADLDPLALRRNVAMVFQQPVALPGTVADNLRVAAPGLDSQALASALDRVGLAADLAERPADQLSGGERQRLALARSLATDPVVVLLDEATSSLDPANAARIEELVAALATSGIHPIWVSHDLAALDRIADHIVVVIGGRIAQQGPLAAVRRNPLPLVERFLTGEAA
jgi:putative ABC transport system ATP-binding protein